MSGSAASRVGVGRGGGVWQPGQPFVVLVHGAGHDHSVWALQARTLARSGWNVAAVDLPGHGTSADDPDLDSIETYASWLLRAVEEIAGIEPVAWVGHSMGAAIALTAAAMAPERSLRLALLGAGERLPVNAALLDDTRERPARAHAFITAFGHGRGSHFGGAETPGVWNLGAALALLERCPAAVLHRDFAACERWRGEEYCAGVSCPTLVIAADGDRMTPPRTGRALAERIAGAQFELVPGSGHLMMAEAPTQVTRLLAGFLGSSEAATSTSTSAA